MTNLDYVIELFKKCARNGCSLKCCVCDIGELVEPRDCYDHNCPTNIEILEWLKEEHKEKGNDKL